MRDFAAAALDGRQFSTEWGTLPTVGIRDLIELKKTQRLGDYPIISALTLRLLEEAKPSRATLAWAAANLFTLEAFFPFNEEYPARVETPPHHAPDSLLKVAGQPMDDVAASVLAAANE